MKNAMEKSTPKLKKKSLKAPQAKSTSSFGKKQPHYDMFSDEDVLLPEEILAEEKESDETLSRTPEGSINTATGWMNQRDEDDELEDEGPGEDEDDDLDEDEDDDLENDVDLDEEEEDLDLDEDTDEDVEDDYEGVRPKAKRK